ncbi:hypothetical protein XAP6164_3790006 [Xanthomonas phaseoli pv. phaseoli]|nr:hypothetical protein XAP6164_3790006 [Xanthomonas phaseoli pv. phaseoli]
MENLVAPGQRDSNLYFRLDCAYQLCPQVPHMLNGKKRSVGQVYGFGRGKCTRSNRHG